jgi:phosphatidylinositol alpha-mannosyltransferase
MLPMLAVDEADCPVVGTVHTYFENSLGYTLGRRYFQRRLDRLAAVVAVSPTVVEAHERYFNTEWTHIPNGVDTDIFSPDAPRPMSIRADMPSILFLGRFDPRNGLATLIESFKRVRTKQRRAQLVVVGDGPLRKYYHRLAAGDPDITFVGAVLGERPEYYANCSLYACPTTKASFGITLLESMACGTPIVCSDLNGFRNVVAHEREAMMVPCGDTGALADTLVAMLEDDALRARLGATGRQRALAYGWPRVSDMILGLYTQILGAHRIAA